MIVSYAEGRVRLRFKELKNRITALAVEKYISKINGITAVEIKTSTGSILITYDPEILPTEKLFDEGKKALNKLGIELELPER